MPLQSLPKEFICHTQFKKKKVNAHLLRRANNLLFSDDAD